MKRILPGVLALLLGFVPFAAMTADGGPIEFRSWGEVYLVGLLVFLMAGIGWSLGKALR